MPDEVVPITNPAKTDKVMIAFFDLIASSEVSAIIVWALI